ncbi:hypothetical protein [Ornithinibacillus contaminans]|uniref:hypothetical protein n=1 Tax=Ornithinibacillus contaminans TaxID=694055 RepID=UPI00064DB0D3|nr:hypothetical protein [Ornithinibacillus contaminans]
MKRQVKGLLYFFATDIRHSVIVFWSILLFVLATVLTLSYFLFTSVDSKMTFGFPFPMYVYCLILGFITVKQSVPFAIKMGATRKSLFVSLGIFFFIMAVAKSIIANTLQEIVQVIMDKTNFDAFMFLHPAMLVENNWLNRVLFDSAIMFFLFMFMFVIGLIFYKYGVLGGASVAGVLAILLLIALAKGWVIDFVTDLIRNIDMGFVGQLAGLGLLLFLISYSFIRRITIEKRR